MNHITLAKVVDEFVARSCLPDASSDWWSGYGIGFSACLVAIEGSEEKARDSYERCLEAEEEEIDCK